MRFFSSMSSPRSLANFIPLQSLPQGHPTRRSNQLDRQPRPQAPRVPRTYLHRQAEPRSRQGSPIQQVQLAKDLEEEQHPLPPPIPINALPASIGSSLGFLGLSWALVLFLFRLDRSRSFEGSNATSCTFLSLHTYGYDTTTHGFYSYIQQPSDYRSTQKSKSKT